MGAAQKELRDKSRAKELSIEVGFVISQSGLKIKRQFAPVALALTLALGLSGTACVSVNIGPGKTEKSDGVSFSAPTGSFKKVDNKRADGAWNNGATGSTIAFQSNCGDSADIALESIAEDLFAGFEDSKELKNERIPFDGREALDREIEGKVDGVMTRVRAIVYKKNKCSYVLTFVALTKALVADTKRKAAINDDIAEFERFAAGFKAP